MKKFLVVLFLLGGLACGFLAWLRHEEAAALRAEIALRRDEQREVARQRGENTRLRASAPAPEQLERLRSDHAAVLRLRSELDALRTEVEKRERAAAVPVAAVSPAAAAPMPPADLTVPLELRGDGAWSLQGASVDEQAIQQRLAVLPKGAVVEFQLREPAAENLSKADVVQQRMMAQRGRATLLRLARELGLKPRISFVRPNG